MWRGLQRLFWRGVQSEICRVAASPCPACRFSTYKRKKAILPDGLFTCLMPWQFPTLTWGDPTLPSALRRFTSEFGMGSGGTTALKPPRQILLICIRLKIVSVSSPKHLRRCKVKPHGSLVSVSSTHRCAYTPDLSTSSSSTFLQET